MSAHGVLLVSHGSRDPRAAETTASIARAVSRATGLPTEVGALELEPVDVRGAMDRLVRLGIDDVRVVPLLLAPGYHVTTDVPSALAEAVAEHLGVRVSSTGALLDPEDGAGVDLVLDAVEGRLAERATSWDAAVLAVSGSTQPSALAVVAHVAGRWAARRSVPILPAAVSGAGERVGDAVSRLVARGHQVAVGSCFVAPGSLPERAAAQALEAGAVSVGHVLGAHPAFVERIVRLALRTPVAP